MDAKEKIKLIFNYSKACRADEMKGGGDPNDFDRIVKWHKTSMKKLDNYIDKLGD